MWCDDDHDAISARGFGELVITNIHSTTDIRTIEAWGRFAGRYGMLALNHRELRNLASEIVCESARVVSFFDAVRR